jgi:hypothetical protein
LPDARADLRLGEEDAAGGHLQYHLELVAHSCGRISNYFGPKTPQNGIIRGPSTSSG